MDRRPGSSRKQGGLPLRKEDGEQRPTGELRHRCCCVRGFGGDIISFYGGSVLSTGCCYRLFAYGEKTIFYILQGGVLY